MGRYNYSNDNTPNIYDYFCNQNCLHQFLQKFCVEIANTYSVKQPSETPIKDPVKDETRYYNQWNIVRTNE